MSLKTIILIGLSLFSLGCIPQVYALESSSSASNSALVKYKISFPISELGNCEDLEACKIYCSSIQNQEACKAYAKARGFYKEKEIPTKAALLLKARSELGCDSEQVCKTICEQKENREKCKAFAEKYQLVTEKLIEDQKKLLELSKELLKCETVQACKELCTKPENQEKCKEVFKLSLTKKEKVEPAIQKVKTAFERAREKFGSSSAKPKPTESTATKTATPSSTSAVQGVSTTPGIFSQFLNFINSLFQ